MRSGRIEYSAKIYKTDEFGDGTDEIEYEGTREIAFLSDIPEDSGYDLVVESDDDFDQCLYPLYKNEENLTRD
jgi:hypothetical protein